MAKPKRRGNKPNIKPVKDGYVIECQKNELINILQDLGVIDDLKKATKKELPKYLTYIKKSKDVENSFEALASILTDMIAEKHKMNPKNPYERVMDLPVKPIIDQTCDEHFYANYIRQLYNNYVKGMRRKGIFEKRASMLAKNNVIDISAVFKERDNVALKETGKHLNIEFSKKMMSTSLTEEEKDNIMQELDWFIAIPVFDDGVIIVHDDLYYKYKILNLDLRLKFISIHLEAYTTILGQWVMSGEANFNIGFVSNEDGDSEVECHIVSAIAQKDMFVNFVNSKEMNWTEKEKNLYRATIGNLLIFEQKGRKTLDANTTTTMQEITDDDSTYDNVSESIYCFMCLWIMINSELYLHKRFPEEQNSGNKATVIYEPESTSDRIVHRIKNMVITSNEEPKEPIDRLTVKYKKVCWINRGGLRRTKLGKVVPVRPAIHYRHALKEYFPDAKPEPSVIKLMEEYKEKETDENDT